MTNRIAVSVAPPDTEACLAHLHKLAPRIGMAEVRLDLMESFDLPRLIGAAPCPLVITCRAPREGGAFAGTETERLAVLAQAIELGCAYVDVEWDCVAEVALWPRSSTRLMVSRHWYDQMPATLWPAYTEMRIHADVVKLVGLARDPADLLPIFDLLGRASGPVVAIAMGAAGQLTRLLAPCFDTCLLTYGAVDQAAITAPGQLSVDELAHLYHLQEAGPHTQICLHLCADAESAPAVVARNAGVQGGAALHVPLVVSFEQAARLAPELRTCLPRLTLTADPMLAPALSPYSLGEKGELEGAAPHI